MTPAERFRIEVQPRIFGFGLGVRYNARLLARRTEGFEIAGVFMLEPEEFEALTAIAANYGIEIETHVETKTISTHAADNT